MKRTFLLFLLSITLSLSAQVKLPPIFTNDMILQQQTDAAIWGKATPGKKVKIKSSWNNAVYTTTVESDSTWRAKISTPKASNNAYEITITSGESLTLRNVLIGEVWFCGGQSNMEQPMSGFPRQPTLGSQEDIVNSANNNLRVFTINRKSSTDLQTNSEGKWAIASPNNTGDFSATAYYFGRQLQRVIDIPIALIHCSWGGSSIQAWMSDEAISKFPDQKVPSNKAEIKRTHQDPTVLYKGMLHSVIGYNIRGAIWYQGETNREQPQRYIEYFKSMHEDWQAKWGSNKFPIYFCQIAPYVYDGRDKNSSALFREAQLEIAKTQPNTGIAILMDAGEESCIHPANKKVVGERLAYIALNKEYGFDNLQFEAPVFKNVVTVNNILEVHFDKLGKGLTSNNNVINDLEIAGEDKIFYPVRAKVNFGKNHLELSHPDVPKPVAVRYAFKNFTVGNLFGVNGLPVSSFRSDNW